MTGDSNGNGGGGGGVDDAVGAAKNALEQGIRVFTIGMGLPDGSPIPVYNDYGGQTGFKKDRAVFEDLIYQNQTKQTFIVIHAQRVCDMHSRMLFLFTDFYPDC